MEFKDISILRFHEGSRFVPRMVIRKNDIDWFHRGTITDKENPMVAIPDIS